MKPSEYFGNVRKGSERFRTVPHRAEAFGKVRKGAETKNMAHCCGRDLRFLGVYCVAWMNIKRHDRKRRKIILRKRSETFGTLQKAAETFRTLRKASAVFRTLRNTLKR